MSLTNYDESDGDYIDADYNKLFNDIQNAEGIDIGMYLEICASLQDDDTIYVTCSNEEGTEWEWSYVFKIPDGWDIETIRAMFSGFVYLQPREE